MSKTYDFDSPAFVSNYHYHGELGAIYSPEGTEFRIWAPTAEHVELIIYNNGAWGHGKNYPMKPEIQGTWITDLPGDLHGQYYNYAITVDGVTNEVVDPYAKACGVNGRRGMIVDLNKTDPDGWDELVAPSLAHVEDTILYELHIRDFSMDPSSGMKHKGKYLAFTERDTKGPHGVVTGIEHLKELGVTHVHLLPFNDFATVDEANPKEYNWGYDPLHYNVPEGSYATDPFHGDVRIKECKQMIKSLMEQGIRVVMDVVYNHTYYSEDSYLNLAVPGYYYRQAPDGSFSNGSGVGNELASERSMVRKFIIDSVTYWAREYKVKGFRFDLMGLHDIKTMKKIRQALDEIDPSIIIYGEGWTGGLSPLPDDRKALKGNVSRMPGVAVFNDDLRDGAKGHTFHQKEPGFVNGGHGAEETIKFGVVGATEHPEVDYGRVYYAKFPWASQPHQCINYVESHDNLNLWDKIAASAEWAREEDRIHMHKLALAIVLTSQGIPFLQAGCEFLRSKQGEHNSYNLPDKINQIHWEDKVKHYPIFRYVQGLITLRKYHPAFRMRDKEQIKEHLRFLETKSPENLVAFNLRNHANDDPWKNIVVVYNANEERRLVDLPGHEWVVVVNQDEAGISCIKTFDQDRILVRPRSSMVLVDEHSFNEAKKIANGAYI